MSNKSKDADPKQPDSSFIQFDDSKQQAPLRGVRPSTEGAPWRSDCRVHHSVIVSLGFVHPSTSGAWSIDWIVQTVTGESVVAKDTKGSGSSAASGRG